MGTVAERSQDLTAGASGRWSWAGLLDRFFRISERGSTIGREVVAGVTTFMTMAYILFVNPDILSSAGVPVEGAAVATALAAALTTLAMGLYANYPFALASGMGLNAALAFGLVLGQGVSWQTAMGVVVVEGLIVTLLVLTNVREAVMDAIPLTLKQAIGAGIGLFIAFIGLQNAGLVVNSDATLVTFGSITDKGPLLAIIGLLLTAVLMSRRVPGAILLGILITTVIGVPLGLTKAPSAWIRWPTAESFSTFFQADIRGVLNLAMLSSVFAFLMTDFFDTMGTVVAVGTEGGLMKDGKLPGLKRVLLVDSLAAALGGLLGASSVTTYVESASGVGQGGRTGLTSVVTGLLFLVAVLFAPLMGIVPSQATAPALILVGFLMLATIKDIPFHDFPESFPAFITLLSIPLTYSIARGIGYGFVTYVVVKLLSGRSREIHPLMWAVAVLFLISFLV
ncbi:MAG: NCS2 family permease [Limnochordales bacterium]|nr:NCS2 family permease [Limnochordales bacterium]